MVGSPFEREEEDYTSESGAIALASALDVSDEAVYIYDAQGRCQWVNRSGEQLLRMDARDIIGQFIFELFPGEATFQIKAWRRVIDAKAPSSFLSRAEVDGDPQKFQTSIFPVMDNSGKVRSVVSIGRRFADRIALQYENQMQGAELALVHEIASIMSSRLDIEQVYERFAAEFNKLVDFDRMVIMEVDDAREKLNASFMTSKRDLGREFSEPVAVSGSAFEWILRYKTTHFQHDLWQRREFETDDRLASKGVRSIIRVPLATRNGVFGLMALASFRPFAFDERARVIAERVAAQIAPAIENARFYQESQNYARELEVIDEVARIVNSSLRIEELCERFALEVKRLVSYDRISVMLAEKNENQELSLDYVVAPNLYSLDDDGRWPVDSTGMGWVVNNRASLLETDMEESQKFPTDSVILQEGFHSVIRIPLILKDRVIGGFALAAEESRGFGPREQRTLELLAAQIAPAIENARLYSEAQERTRELEVIDEIAGIMTSNLHIDEVYERFASEVKRLVEFDRMSVILANEHSDTAMRIYSAGVDTEALRSMNEWVLKGTDVQWVVEHGESIIENSLMNPDDERFAIDELVCQAGLKSGIKVPLVNKDRVIGTFALWSLREGCYGKRECRILERLAAQVAPAIENARLYEEVEQTLDTLRSTQEQLVKVERLRAMGELASGVAHDFNNALAAILGQTQLMMKHSPSEGHRRSLELIEQSAHDSAHVVRRILDFARFEAETDFSGVNVNQLISDVVDLTRHKWHDDAQSKGLTINVSIHPGDVPKALGNYADLREVLMNMLINACEAIESDGSLNISTSCDEEYVVISVADTGMGMTPEVKQKIFEPFFTSKGASGNGLGLSVAFGIIARHNGTIEVDSEVGEGTTMRIYLPIATDLEDVEEVEEPQDLESSKIAKILVIEDEPLIRETLADMLAIGEHEVTMCEEGEKALQAFAEGEYDMVFTDLGMPGLSGWDVSRLIKEIRTDCPVVMVTGWGAAIDHKQMEENGVDEVLPKPFDIDVVLKLVQRLADRKDS